MKIPADGKLLRIFIGEADNVIMYRAPGALI